MTDFDQYTSQMEQKGRDWLDGRYVCGGFGEYEFNTKQELFFNKKERSVLAYGGMSSGKTLGFIVKLILLSQWFPGSHFLVGRKTQGNAEDTFMKDFMDVCPGGLYTHQKGYHKIVFTNGSEVEFWGLDALQSGNSTDIKKAEQKLKSHNFTFIFVDQLEEIEQKVYDALHSRMRRRMCQHEAKDMDVVRDKNDNPIYEKCKICGKYTFNQFVATTNPAHHWSYDWFVKNPRPNTSIVQFKTLDNEAHLTRSFIEGEMTKPRLYKMRFFDGIWDETSMTEGGVFYEEWITDQALMSKSPIRVLDGIKIFEEPKKEIYQIGIDPSLGSTDPSNITVVSKESGKVVATYTAYIPTDSIVQTAVRLAGMYSMKEHPLIIPEATGVGQALVESLKRAYDNIYVREVYSTKSIDKKTSKLGFYTTHATKTQLIEHMKSLFLKGIPKIYDKDTIDEMRTFIYTDSALEKGAGAQQGCHDDRIMGMMLAYWGVNPTLTIDELQDETEFKMYSTRYI